MPISQSNPPPRHILQNLTGVGALMGGALCETGLQVGVEMNFHSNRRYGELVQRLSNRVVRKFFGG